MRIFQFGNGKWGKNHTRILRGNGHNVSVFDIDSDHKEVLQDTPDAVVVTCSTVNHFPITLYCLERGIPVFCEKPICLEQWQLKAYSYYKDNIFMGGHQLCFLPELKGLSGHVQYINCVRSGAIPRTEGALFSLAVHDVAVVQMLTGKCELIEVLGSLHKAKISLNRADILVESFSHAKLRHMVMVTDSGIIRLNPENWQRVDLVEMELNHFIDSINKGVVPLYNNMRDCIDIMDIIFKASERLCG